MYSLDGIIAMNRRAAASEIVKKNKILGIIPEKTLSPAFLAQDRAKCKADREKFMVHLGETYPDIHGSVDSIDDRECVNE